MAMVPLLLIRTNVMMAIRSRGMLLPHSVRPKTSLGLGQGSVVDMRTVMYEVRKQLKMKMSLRRKIHIIALPQGTRNACLSDDQSDTTPGRPAGVTSLGDSLADVAEFSAAAPRKLPSAEVGSPWVVSTFSDIGV